MKSSLSIIYFMGGIFGIVFLKNHHTQPPRFSHILSSNNFIVLYFIFMSIIHFELIFVTGIRSGSTFIFFQVYIQKNTKKLKNQVHIQLFHHFLLRRHCFILLPLLLCQSSVDYIYGFYFWALYFVRLLCLCIFFVNISHFYIYSKSVVEEHQSSNLIFFLYLISFDSYVYTRTILRRKANC